VFCGHCGARLQPTEPFPAPTPAAPTKTQGGLPVVPIVIGAVILILVVCLCLVVGGLAGLCALPGIVPSAPTPRVILPPEPTEVAIVVTATPAPGFTVAPRSPTSRPATEVVVTATRPPAGDVSLRIVSYVQRTDALSGSSVEIMGEVENTSNKDVDTGWYLVYVTLKGKDGNVIPTSKELTTNLQRPIMQPGQKSCFRYFFSASSYGFDISQVDKLEAEVRENPKGHDAYTVELAVSNVKRSGNTITGDITNNTQYSTRSVFILITLYDAGGQVIGVHYATRVGDEKMKPGGTMSLTYNITSSDAARTKSFDVLVIAYKEL